MNNGNYANGNNNVQVSQTRGNVEVKITKINDETEPPITKEQPVKDVKRILVLSANPKETEPSRSDLEINKISECLVLSKFRDQFNLELKLAVEYSDIVKTIMTYRPNIVHFSGHGTGNGLIVEHELGMGAPVNSDVFAAIFEEKSDEIECVVLNACHTESLAAAVSRHIGYVIGMRGEIYSKAAMEFAVGFYNTLFALGDIKDAFKSGCNAIRHYSNLTGTGRLNQGQSPSEHAEYRIPVLMKR